MGPIPRAKSLFNSVMCLGMMQAMGGITEELNIVTWHFQIESQFQNDPLRKGLDG